MGVSLVILCPIDINIMDILTILSYGFIQRAFIAGVFVAIVCALLGTFLVLRNLSLIGDGLSHVSFGAIALGLFFGFYPIYIAIPVVVLASLLILKLTEKAKLYGDAAIGIVSSVGIASGVILASVSRGFNVDLFSYLFGNILSISQEDVFLSVFLSGVVVMVVILFYQDLFSLTFSQELAQVSGVKTNKISSFLVILTAITVVLSVRVVGIMLISSLLILPAVTSLQISRGFKMTLLLGALFAAVSVVLGIFISFIFNIPTGATIVLVNFGMFCLAYFVKK